MKVCFFAVLMIILFEYMAIPQYMPLLKGLNISFFLSLAVLAWAIVKGGLKGLFGYKQTKVLTGFILLTCISLLYALIGMRVVTILKVQIGNFIIFCACYYVLRDMRRINLFIAFYVLIHVLIVFLNIEELLMVGRTSVIKAGYFLGDLNDFGWSLAIVLPFALHLFSATPIKLGKLLWLGSLITIVSGIILTQSRGAAIAAASSIVVLVLTGKRRALGIAIFLCAAVLIVTLGPASYVHRLQTIGSYEEDSSARGRLMAWKAAVAMAIDNPLGVGAGNFPSVYGRFYRSQFADANVWAPNRWVAVHSIYFLTLAEYGFIGIILLLLLIYWNFLSNIQTARVEDEETGQKTPGLTLPKTLNASLTAFAAGGVFLGGFHYPNIYILSCLTIVLAAQVGSDED